MHLIYHSTLPEDQTKVEMKNVLRNEGYMLLNVHTPEMIMNEIDASPLANYAVFFDLSNDNIKECRTFLEDYKKKEKSSYGEVILIAPPALKNDALILMSQGASDVIAMPADMDLILAKLQRIHSMRESCNVNTTAVSDQLQMVKLQLLAINNGLKSSDMSQDDPQREQVLANLGNVLMEFKEVGRNCIAESSTASISIPKYVSKIFVDYGWGYDFGDAALERYTVKVDVKYFISALSDLVEKLIALAKAPQNIAITYAIENNEMIMSARILESNDLTSLRLTNDSYFDFASKVISLSRGSFRCDRVGTSSVVVRVSMPIA